MRSASVWAARSAVFGAAAAICGSSAFADLPPVASPPRHQIVYLFTSAQLEQLRQSNPRHYAQAQRILAAANTLCKPGADEVTRVSLDVHDLKCFGALMMTSNPPKTQLSFRLDDTRYVAIVTLTDAGARAMPAVNVTPAAGK